MKSFLFSILVLLAGCQSFTSIRNEGHLFAYVKMTKGAFTGPAKARNGFYFYIEGSQKADPSLIGYHYKKGLLVDTCRSADSRTVVAALRAIDIEPFDYRAEIARCEARILADEKDGIMRRYPPIVLDGAEYEIVVVTKKGTLTLLAWNPGPSLEYYSSYSDKIANLKSVLDLLSQHCGNAELGI